MSQQFPLELSDKVHRQIGYLCSKISANEWSGILFYRTEGRFGTPSFKCIMEDILPMDVGTRTSTEYQYNGEVVKYMMEHPELLDCVKGHIHSHNEMGVFFSGVDERELEQNSRFFNFYLSLIVNNAGHMMARIGCQAKVEQVVSSCYTLRNEKGETVKSVPIKTESEKDIFINFECKIIKPGYNLGAEFEDRCQRLIDQAASRLNTPAAPKQMGLPFGTMVDPLGQLSVSPEATMEQHHEEPMTIEKFMHRAFTGYPFADGDLVSFFNQREGVSTVDMQYQCICNNLNFYVVSAYAECYPNDPNMLAYSATLEECIDVLQQQFPDTELACRLIDKMKQLLKLAYECDTNEQ